MHRHTFRHSCEHAFITRGARGRQTGRHTIIHTHRGRYIRTHIHTYGQQHDCMQAGGPSFIHTYGAYNHTHYITTYISTITHMHTHLHTYIHTMYTHNPAGGDTYTHTAAYIHSGAIHTYYASIQRYREAGPQAGIHTHGHSYPYKESNACLHTYIHTLIHSYVHTGIHTYIYTGMHTYIHTGRHQGRHAYMDTHLHIYVHNRHTYIQPGRYRHTIIHMHGLTHIYIHIHRGIMQSYMRKGRPSCTHTNRQRHIHREVLGHTHIHTDTYMHTYIHS